jgi:hypothetical protein
LSTQHDYGSFVGYPSIAFEDISLIASGGLGKVALQVEKRGGVTSESIELDLRGKAKQVQ